MGSDQNTSYCIYNTAIEHRRDYSVKNLTEMIFILDKRDTMAGLDRDTIGGLNAMIQ